MAIILHITRQAEWQEAGKSGEYAGDALKTRGFIHCSTPEQVIRVADFLFRGQKGLVLLGIDTDGVQAEIPYENLEGGAELFPHIYGPVAVKAVVRVCDFRPGEDGTFEMPEEMKGI
jgi:uncharacterized protein (DUF952 family)